MRDLPFSVRAIGQPVVAGTLTLGLVGIFLWLAQAGTGGMVAGLGLLIPAAWIARAAQAVRQQRQWKRAWDSYAPSPQTPRRKLWKPVVGFAGLAGLAIANGGMTAAEITLGLLAVLVGTCGVILSRRKRALPEGRKPVERQHPAVAVLVRRPVMPVPDLKQAYAALPPHSWAAIDGRR